MAVQRLSNSGQSGYGYKSLIAGITPIPSVPTIGSATAVNFESVNVAFTAPGAYAGSTYTATSSPGGFTGTSASSPILVSGLSESTAYTFTVTATNATGTSGASAASSPVTTPAGDNGVMFPIQMVSVGAAGAATISFTSIPSTYTHLQMRATYFNSTVSDFYVKLNSNISLKGHGLYGGGVTANSGSDNSTANGMNWDQGQWTTTNPSVIIADILDYTSTTKNKTVRILGGQDNNGGTGAVWLRSALYDLTAAVTSITITPDYPFAQYTSIALYGIKGA